VHEPYFFFLSNKALHHKGTGQLCHEFVMTDGGSGLCRNKCIKCASLHWLLDSLLPALPPSTPSPPVDVLLPVSSCPVRFAGAAVRTTSRG
jgi:hypothetical protein